MDEQSLELTQQGILQEERRFQLKNNRELRVARKNSGKEREYAVSLLALAQPGQRALRLNWKLLLAAILTLLVMFVLLQQQALHLVRLGDYALHVALVMSLLAMVFLLLCVRTFSYDYVFYSQHAHVPLVELMVAKPSRQAYRSFINRLESRIRELQDHMALPLDKQLAGELRTIRRLTEEGVLDAKYYPDVKDQLLKLIDQDYKKNKPIH